MGKKTFFAAMLLMMVGLQTMWGQEMVLHKSNGEKIKCELSKLDSLVFVPKALPPTHGWVDLGLPSGTLWAKCNVGANKPEEYGDYFAWGETQPKDIYTWDTYKWYKYYVGTKMTKYCSQSGMGYHGYTDTLTELLPEDDAATTNWGSSWQTPSAEQLDELVNSNYTTTEWITQNGIDGYKITSISNGNSIFLPAAGFCNESYYYDTNLSGFYWSRSLYTGYCTSAYLLRFFSTGEKIETIVYSRETGRTVRPVHVQ